MSPRNTTPRVFRVLCFRSTPLQRRRDRVRVVARRNHATRRRVCVRNVIFFPNFRFAVGARRRVGPLTRSVFDSTKRHCPTNALVREIRCPGLARLFAWYCYDARNRAMRTAPGSRGGMGGGAFDDDVNETNDVFIIRFCPAANVFTRLIIRATTVSVRSDEANSETAIVIRRTKKKKSESSETRFSLSLSRNERLGANTIRTTQNEFERSRVFRGKTNHG